MDREENINAEVGEVYPGGENGAGGALEPEPRPRGRDAMLDRLKKKYPGEEFPDDDHIYDRLNQDWDTMEAENRGLKENQGKFADMFYNDPRSSALFLRWRDGEDPAVNLIRLYGEEISDAIDDPQRQEEIAKANREYMERVAKSKQYEAEYEENLKKSLELLEKIQKERGLSDDTIDEAMDTLMKMATDAMLGRFSEEALDFALKGKGYDRDVALAREEGNISGRNSRISEELRKPQRDTVPHFGGANNKPAPERGQSIFDLAREAQ